MGKAKEVLPSFFWMDSLIKTFTTKLLLALQRGKKDENLLTSHIFLRLRTANFGLFKWWECSLSPLLSPCTMIQIGLLGVCNPALKILRRSSHGSLIVSSVVGAVRGWNRPYRHSYKQLAGTGHHSSSSGLCPQFWFETTIGTNMRCKTWNTA